jgi:phosphoribosylaminoimidazole (AIR) synthetase
VPLYEMDQVFNMGIGMVLIVPARSADKALALTNAIKIREITKGKRDVQIS